MFSRGKWQGMGQMTEQELEIYWLTEAEIERYCIMVSEPDISDDEAIKKILSDRTYND
jgi:hypothetical protein